DAGELCEKQNKLEPSIEYFERAASHFHHGKNDAETDCRKKVIELNNKKNWV
ncbi:hypothetical protein MKX03_030559, partial [Papaver bracteatum]